MLAWLKYNSTLPPKAINIPTIFIAGTTFLKNIAPIITAKMGVNALSTPAVELSKPVSAMQNRYAGNRLPSMPLKNTSPSFFTGNAVKFLSTTGSKTMPADNTLNDATCTAESPFNATLISMKLLPHTRESAKKMIQFISLVLPKVNLYIMFAGKFALNYALYQLNYLHICLNIITKKIYFHGHCNRI